MPTTHLSIDETKANLIRSYCGWRVARRHTTILWRDVTCSLCLGRRDGITRQAIREAKAATDAPKGDAA